MIETPRGTNPANVSELRSFLEEASSAEVEFSPVTLPGGRTVLAKRLLWSEADGALQAASKSKPNLESEEIENKVEVNLVRYNAVIFASGAYFQGANDGKPIRVYNPHNESDLRKVEALPKSIFKPWFSEIQRFNGLDDDAEEAAKNDSSEMEEGSFTSFSRSGSDALTSPLSAVA